MISVRRHLSRNRPGLPQKLLETPSTVLFVKRVGALGLWVLLRHPIFTTGSMSFWLADTAKERQHLFLYCSLFSTFFVPATHFIASPRSPGIGRLPETVKHLAVSPCTFGLGLQSGLTVHF